MAVLLEIFLGEKRLADSFHQAAITNGLGLYEMWVSPTSFQRQVEA
jgi:hypothetical protein